MLAISTGIEAPNSLTKRGRPPIYPFANMKAGQYFDAQIRDGESPENAARRLANSSTSWRSRHHSSLAFLVRIVRGAPRSTAWIRVWAIESEPPVRRGVADFFKPA